ncbi:hypothetical protein GW932_02625 [archaeon]|nr:hypothetical protein [archaeon]
MKALKPSHKEDKRYLLLEGKQLKKNVPLAIKEFIGTLGLSETVLIWIEENILSINRKSLEKVRAAFLLWPEEIKILKVSGTLKGLRK